MITKIEEDIDVGKNISLIDLNGSKNNFENIRGNQNSLLV